jgi:DNA-binding transcriptional MerR regulator
MIMDRRKVGDVAKTFGTDPQTIRKWSEVFKDYLSDDANPPPGATRYYSDDDLQALAFVYRARRNDSTFEEIHEALNRGEHRLSMPNLIPLGDSEIGGPGSGKQIIRYDDAEKWVRLEGQLHEVKEERNHLRAALTSEQQAHMATRAQAARYEERARLLEAPKEPTRPPFPVWLPYVATIALLAIVALLVVLAWQAVAL